MASSSLGDLFALIGINFLFGMGVNWKISFLIFALVFFANALFMFLGTNEVKMKEGL